MSRAKKTPKADQAPVDPAPISAPPTEEAEESVLGQPTQIPSVDEQQAGHIRDTVPSLFMYASMIQPFRHISEDAYKIFRKKLLADCNASDPIETMLVEQLALAHMNMGLLHCKAANARQVEAVSVYSAAAARLMAEFRRSALGLAAYRAATRHPASSQVESTALVAGDLADLEDLPEKMLVSTEMDSTRSDDDEEQSVLPMPRAAAR
jgi:hypothetical protein